MAATTALLTAEKAVSNAPHGRWELVRGEVATYMPVQPEHARCVQRLWGRKNPLDISSALVIEKETMFRLTLDASAFAAADCFRCSHL